MTGTLGSNLGPKPRSVLLLFSATSFKSLVPFNRRGAGAVERGGLEMRLVPSRPIPKRPGVSGDLDLPRYPLVPPSCSIPASAEPSGANLGANFRAG